MRRNLTQKEVVDWHRRWQHVFAVGIHNVEGKWSVDGTDFSVFDHRFMTKFTHGAQAEVEYESAEAEELILLFREGRRQFGEHLAFPGGAKPSIGELKGMTARGDFLVFPLDLRWSAFFHHEDWVPVYFAYREWV